MLDNELESTKDSGLLPKFKNSLTSSQISLKLIMCEYLADKKSTDPKTEAMSLLASPW